jgi:hypothetical protein
MTEAAFDWLLTRDPVSLEKARWRAKQIATWSPTGATSHTAQPQVSRDIAFALARVYDWLYSELSVGERAALYASIALRWQQIVRDFTSESGEITHRPEDLLQWNNLGITCAIAALMQGDQQLGNTKLDALLPLYLQAFGRWTGADGGFAPGTSYALSVLELQLPIWDTLRAATGVDVYQHPWVSNLPAFFLQFLPNAMATHAFGDGAESVASAPLLYALASRSALPAVRAAYLPNLAVQNQSFLFSLAAPVVDEAGTQAPASSAYFASVGWASLRSASTAEPRVALHFKSSPFGSGMHSHADQNSFTLQINNKPVLLDSGYYDWWGSPHWLQWYAQTRAHNAITYNGGIGQRIKDASAAGRVVAFADHDSSVYVSGDATAAYDAPVRRAHRAVIFQRPGTLATIDHVAADRPLRWEWNLHTRQPLQRMSSHRFRLYDEQAKAGVCLDIIEPAEFDFLQTDRFTAPPEPSALRPPQWHAVLSLKSAAATATFVVGMSIDCNASTTPVRIRPEGVNLVVELGPERFRLLSDARVVRESP